MYWVYQDPRSPAPKGNSKLEILLVKIFSLKQKTSQILPATILSFQDNSLWFL